MSRDKSVTPTVQAIGELHLEGNIIPHSFFTRREFKSDYGITQHIAIMIYADDLYWYRPTYHRDELTGKVLKTTRKFEADKLQRTYDYYAGLFGVSKQQATDAVKFLVDRGLTTREFRTIRLADGRKASNVMYVEPVVEALKVLLQADERGGDGWFWVAEPPKPNVKKNKAGEGEGIPNKRDTYPEYSGYVSDLSKTRIRNNRDTNTKTSTGTSSKTSAKSGGEYNVVDNARGEAQQEPHAPSVAQPGPAQPTTSGNASLQNSRDEGEAEFNPAALPLPQLPSPPTAVLELPAPDGVTAGAVVEDSLLTDEDIDLIFGTGNADETKALEQVAGGGAATETAQEGPSEDETEPHDPEETRAVLVPALGGQSKLNSFMEEQPPGLRGKSRRAWITEIRPSRAVELVNQGRIEANAANPWTFIIRLLDVEIGSVIAGKSASQREPVTPLPGAYLTAAEKEAQATHYPAVTAGEQWQSRKSGKKFEIEEVTSQTVFVLDLGEYTLQKFHATFEPAEAQA